MPGVAVRKINSGGHDLRGLEPDARQYCRRRQHFSFTSVKARHLEILRDQSKASEPLLPLAGIKSLNVPTLTQAEYIDLVDFTGRDWHSGKRGRIEASEPRALRKLGLDKDH